jgi:hypothetical protein
MPVVLLLLLFSGAVALSWRLITRTPPPRAASRPAAPLEPGFFSVAGAAVDLEVFAPDGRHTSTTAGPDSSMKIPLSDGHVECDNYGDPKATESNCTASVVIKRPAYGEYRIVASSADKRAETLNVGFGGEGFRRAGGFDVHVAVEPRKTATFTVSVVQDGASLRTPPHP